MVATVDVEPLRVHVSPGLVLRQAGVGARVRARQARDGQHGRELVHPDHGASRHARAVLGPGNVDGAVALEDRARQAESISGLEAQGGREGADLGGH